MKFTGAGSANEMRDKCVTIWQGTRVIFPAMADRVTRSIVCCWSDAFNTAKRDIAILMLREFVSASVSTVEPLRWRHNERHGVWNHQHLYRLLNRLFRHTSMKTSKLRVTGLCEGNPKVIGGFPSQRANNAENVSIWLHHHAMHHKVYC